MSVEVLPSVEDVNDAALRIAPYVFQTPLWESDSINALTGARILFKCENLQRVGAFKARGAHNAVFSLSDGEARHGVATHSSGNHAAALALAAQRRGIPAHIVMPVDAPVAKIAAVKSYGGRIRFCEPTLPARETGLAEILTATGAHQVHPYDDARVIAGQGTVGLEILQQCEALSVAPDIVITPVGGGGLLSGVSLAIRSSANDVSVLGAEPSGADDAARSFRSGQLQIQEAPDTIADGLRSSLGHLGFALIQEHVDDILTVTEMGIIEAMRLVWSRMNLVAEPSAAVGLAAIMEHAEQFQAKTVVAVLTGGNVDLDKLPWMS